MNGLMAWPGLAPTLGVKDAFQASAQDLHSKWNPAVGEEPRPHALCPVTVHCAWGVGVGGCMKHCSRGIGQSFQRTQWTFRFPLNFNITTRPLAPFAFALVGTRALAPTL